jgi:hypothetical protein
MPTNISATLATITLFALISLSCGGEEPVNANVASNANLGTNTGANRIATSNSDRSASNSAFPYPSPRPGGPSIQSGNSSYPYPQSGDLNDPAVGRKPAGSGDLVMANLHATLRTWSSGDEYSSTASLRSVWVGSGKAEKTFYPHGADQLISAVRSNTYFSQCGKYSGALRTTMFAPGGPIQTVDHLYKRLYRCDPSN